MITLGGDLAELLGQALSPALMLTLTLLKIRWVLSSPTYFCSLLPGQFNIFSREPGKKKNKAVLVPPDPTFKLAKNATVRLWAG